MAKKEKKFLKTNEKTALALEIVEKLETETNGSNDAVDVLRIVLVLFWGGRLQLVFT